MIRIYNGNDTKVVTQGVYDAIYKPLGYKIVLENTQKKVVEPIKKEEETTKQKPIKDIVKESVEKNTDNFNKYVGTVTRRKKSGLKKNKKEE